MRIILLFCREGDIYDDVDYKGGKFSLNVIIKIFYAIHAVNFKKSQNIFFSFQTSMTTTPHTPIIKACQADSPTNSNIQPTFHYFFNFMHLSMSFSLKLKLKLSQSN